MSTFFELRVLRPVSPEDDVWLFDSWTETRKAEAFCRDFLDVVRVEVVEVTNRPASDVDSYKAFKADIMDLEGIDRDPDPDLTESQSFIDAACWRGEDSGNDIEIDDLRAYFQAAFDLLTPEQKTKFLMQDDVQSRIKAAIALARKS